MCGIAGVVHLNSSQIKPERLTKMGRKISHRGPDDEGVFISSDKKIGLVSRRLAIIDLSSRGHQPMSYLNRYWITYNGEIYNFQEERKKLERDGYKFRSRTDTEVILALYHKYGKLCLKHLRGMFAFAIYDKKENTIFLARDRLGKKPLKYYFKNGLFIFASELKSILSHPEVKKIPDWEAIDLFLTYGYTPSPKTGFVDIHKLEPAHYLLLDLKTCALTKTRYWDLDFNHKLNLSENEWTDKIITQLTKSTKERLISDVPLGAFLSGGIDSSMIVATMAKLSSKPVKTFTVAFKDSQFNESHHAKRVSDLYGTEHQELEAKTEAVDEILPFLVYHYEEPYADSSNVVTYLVSKLARKFVTVVLNGDGGDENFAGYTRYLRLKRDVAFDKIKTVIHPTIPLINFLTRKGLPKKADQIHKFLQKSQTPLSHRFTTYNFFFSGENKQELYSQSLKKNTRGFSAHQYYEDKFSDSEAVDPRDRALYADLMGYFPESLLTKVDIASMAASLESRSPFVDHEMVETASQIPFNLKIKHGETKFILKKAAEKLIPRSNIYRPKMGFSIPLSLWFSGKLNRYASSVLLNPKARINQIFNSPVIKTMLRTHTPQNDFGPRLWALLSLELWFEQFFPG